MVVASMDLYVRLTIGANLESVSTVANVRLLHALCQLY